MFDKGWTSDWSVPGQWWVNWFGKTCYQRGNKGLPVRLIIEFHHHELTNIGIISMKQKINIFHPDMKNNNKPEVKI